MKKLITGLVFSLLILMACVSPILADGASVVLDLTEMQRYEMADSLCWIDDSLYVLGNKGVYSWKSGSEKMNTVIDLAVASNYDYVQDCPEDESEATVWNQMLQLIFTDGEALYGLHPYSGMIKKIEGNAQTDVAEIQREYLYSEDMEAYREIRQAVYADKKLYLLLGTDTYEEYDKTELYAFDLDTSEMELVDIEGVNSIMLGAEGTLLIQTNDALSSAVQYDVESGTLGEEILTVGEDERIAGVAWDAVDQRYVRFVQGQVITCDADGNEIGMVVQRVLTFLPKFEIYKKGTYIGCLSKEFSFLMPHYNIDYNGWHIDGSIMEWDYNILDQRGYSVASVSKELFHMTDTYVIQVNEPEYALDALMFVLAIDAEKCSRT